MSRPVFCGNFEYETRQSDLERLFSKYGRVERVDMKSGNNMTNNNNDGIDLNSETHHNGEEKPTAEQLVKAAKAKKKVGKDRRALKCGACKHVTRACRPDCPYRPLFASSTTSLQAV